MVSSPHYRNFQSIIIYRANDLTIKMMFVRFFLNDYKNKATEFALLQKCYFDLTNVNFIPSTTTKETFRRQMTRGITSFFLLFHR